MRPGKHRMTIEPLEARIAPAATALAVAHALDLPGGVAVSVTGNPLAIATQTLGTTGQLLGFPSGSDGDFLILSTGIATNVTTLQNTSDSQGTDLGIPGVDGDEISVQFSMPVPMSTGAQRLKLDFMFLTEEYPEFVGAGFNDTFQVFINGTNYAKDEFGNPIDVDNAFFIGAPAPGTFFDGRTNKLTLNYLIPDGTTTLDIELRLMDVGDGVLDSAVLVDNVRFESPQLVFLDFDGGTLVNHFGAGVTGTLPAFSAADVGSADATADIVAQLLAKIQGMYAGYDILFTTTEPVTGDYTRLVIGGNNDVVLDLSGASILTQQQAGGTSATVRDFFDLGSDTMLGLAGAPDVGNLDRSDQAAIFSGEFVQFFASETVDARIDQLAVTIAHELGHNLGLRHVDDTNFSDIMKLSAPRDTGATFGTTLLALAETWSDGVTEQNDDSYLTSVLGKSGGTSIAPALTQNSASFSTTSSTTLYDVTISISVPGNDNAPIILHFDTFDGSNNIHLPQLPANATFTLTGASIEGGPINVFSGKSTGGTLDPAATAVPLFQSDGGLASIPLSKSKGTSYSSFGSLPLKANALGDVTVAQKGVVKLTDSDGDAYTIRLTGPGVFGYVLSDPDLDGKGGLDRLVFDGTTAGSVLKITVKKGGGGDGFVEMGEIAGTLGASLKTLNAQKTDLTAGGLTLDGTVRDLWFHDLGDGGNIFTGAGSGVVTTVKAHVIGDGSNLAFGTDLGLFKAAIFKHSAFSAPSVKAFELRGDAKASIDGNFMGDARIVGVLGKLNVHDVTSGALIEAGGLFFDSTVLSMQEVADGAVINIGSVVTSMKAAKVGHAVVKADAFRSIIISGDVAGEISAIGGIYEFRANDVLGSANIAGGGIASGSSKFIVHEIDDGAHISVETSITKLKAVRIGDAIIHAARIGTLSVTGDARLGIVGDFNGSLTLSGGDDSFDNALGIAEIAGSLNGARLVVDSISEITAHSLVDSHIYAGYAPADPAAPMGGGVFFEAGLINSLTIKSGIDAVANSIIAGTVVKTVKFGSIVTDNSGTAFGIISDSALKKLTVPGFVYDKTGAADQSLGDFHVILA